MDSRKLVLSITCQQPEPQSSKGFVAGRWMACGPVLFWLMSSSDNWFCRVCSSHGRDILTSGQSPNLAFYPSSGAEQTEKADAPREPPPVELKPDPTSGMAAAEAEALSESSEQGAPPPSQGRPCCAHPEGLSPTVLVEHLFHP